MPNFLDDLGSHPVGRAYESLRDRRVFKHALTVEGLDDLLAGAEVG